jgi:WD repeat-containing protein 22
MKRQYKSFNLIHHLRDEALKSIHRSKYFQNRFDCYSTLYCQDGKGHSGCVNALDFSSDGLLLASGGDDKRVLIWNMSQILFNETNQSPIILNATHLSNIFSIKFDNQNRRIISAGKSRKLSSFFKSFFLF